MFQKTSIIYIIQEKGATCKLLTKKFDEKTHNGTHTKTKTRF